MSKFTEKEEREKYKPSAREAKDLSEKLATFEKKEVNGRMQYPYELFLESEKIISFDRFGMIQVVNPFQYWRYNQINSLREWIDEQEMEKMFVMYPDSREEYREKIAALKVSVRDLLHLKAL